MAGTEAEKSSWCEIPGHIKRPALSDISSIGELYDARTESFSHRSLFSNNLPKEFIRTPKLPNCEISYSYKDTLSERLKLFKVEGEFQLSIISGIISGLGVKGEYLSEEKQSERTISSTLSYNLLTKCESLLYYANDIKEYIDEDAFLVDRYTHVVVEIIWGANCSASLECSNIDYIQKTELEGMLKGELMKLGCIAEAKASGGGCYEDSENKSVKTFQLKFRADVIPKDKIPTKMKEVEDYILTDLPELIKGVNEDKGKPLYYIMVPISDFKSIFKYKENETINTVIKTIDDSFTKQIVNLFQNMEVLKQKLNDLVTDFSPYEKYLYCPPQIRKETDLDCLTEIQNMKQKIETSELKLKNDLKKDLPKVRAGKIDLMDLIVKVDDDYKSESLNSRMIQRYIDKFAVVKNHINDIKNLYAPRNIIYVGKDENLDYIMSRNINNDFFVMYTSEELKNKNEDLARKNQIFFLSEAEKQKKNTVYVIINFDVKPGLLLKEMTEVKIVSYKNGQIISHDVYKDHEAEKALNFANSNDLELIEYKPNNRVTLELPCPGFRFGLHCPKEQLKWTCIKCKENLEYGFDNFFYCYCGRAPIQSYELKCNSLNHGNEFLKVSDDRFPLKNELKNLTPLKELNILILGQTGVGKSTWINSIANYLRYETLDEAIRGGVICKIPASFTISTPTDNGIVEQVVKIGENDPNEVTKIGKSATRRSKTYHFILKDMAIRLIDTPGVGDTGGIDHDKENMKNIIDHISHLEEIHGIVILLKCGEPKIDALFTFCILELLIHLHKNAAKNIVFCFTKARGTDFKPGDTLSVLHELLKQVKLDKITTLCSKSIFCLDNEGFRFLCELKYPDIIHTDEVRNAVALSWEKSVEETKRFFEHIKHLEPHIVEYSTTLCKARFRILNLTKPILDVQGNIQENKTAIEIKEKLIKNSTLSAEELSKQLYIPEITFEPKYLDYPRTVCTNVTCVIYYKSNFTERRFTEYTTICHDHCKLEGIVTESVPQSGLRNCWAMECGESAKCRKCGCGWEHHMHITYLQERVETKVINHSVQKLLNDEKSNVAAIESTLLLLKEKREQYKREEEEITKIAAQFAIFLKDNAIAPYNDGFKNYLEYLINQEESRRQKTQEDRDVLKNLHEMMKRYEKEVKAIRDEIEKCKNQNVPKKKLTPKDIIELEKKLYNLKLTGCQIKKHADVAKASNLLAIQRSEQPLTTYTPNLIQKCFAWK